MLYLVSRLLTDADTIYLTEAWTSREAHHTSLQDEATRAAIDPARPLIAHIVASELQPVGGKGLEP